MIIRPFEEKDKENVRFVCLNSEGPCQMTPDESHYILTTYCNYYIENEGHNCFIAADEDDKAIAYIICTENFDEYKKVFLEEYVPRLDENLIVWGGNAREGARTSFKLQEKYKNDYPAHLHIDVLPEYHRQGIGHMLVNTLKEHLHKKGAISPLQRKCSPRPGQNFPRQKASPCWSGSAPLWRSCTGFCFYGQHPLFPFPEKWLPRAWVPANWAAA